MISFPPKHSSNNKYYAGHWEGTRTAKDQSREPFLTHMLDNPALATPLPRVLEAQWKILSTLQYV